MQCTVSHEALVFAVMTLCGVIFGVLFDMLRAVRSEFASGRGIVHITDAFFWIAAGAVTVYMLVRFNDGILRMYEFFGMFMGGFLYFYTVSPFIKRVFTSIFRFLHTFIVLFFKILLTPTLFLYKILLRHFKGLCTFFVKRKKKDGEKKEKKKHAEKGCSA